MKKGRWLLWLFVGLCLGVVVCVLVYLLVKGGVDWESYLVNTIIPEATVIVTSIGTLCLLIQPILNKLAEAGALFKKAKEQIDTTVESNKTQEQQNIATEDRVAALEAKVDHIEQTAENNEKILRIGFGNMKELVVNGYAHEIEKVGKDDEKETVIEI